MAYRVFPPALSNPLLPAPTYRLSHWFLLAARRIPYPSLAFLRLYVGPPDLITPLKWELQPQYKIEFICRHEVMMWCVDLFRGKGLCLTCQRLHLRLTSLNDPAPPARISGWMYGHKHTPQLDTKAIRLLISWGYLRLNPRNPAPNAFYNYLAGQRTACNWAKGSLEYWALNKSPDVQTHCI